MATINTVKRFCDVCGKEVGECDSFGKLKFHYSEKDWAGNGAPAGRDIDDICLDCCRKLDHAICDTLSFIKMQGGQK